VNGNTLYRLNRILEGTEETYTIDSLGTIEGEGRVSMADNGTQLMVLVPGGKGYIYNEDASTPFQEILDAGFYENGNPQIVIFVDGFFACTTDSKRWIISNLKDGLSWSPLDYGTAESDPDITVSLVTHNNQVFLFGSVTTEVFQNVGVQGLQSFPFRRNNVFLDKGCVAKFSVVKAFQTFFMLGAGVNETPAFYTYNGNNFEPISTDAIDYILARYTPEDIESCFGWSYAEGGAYFVGWTFPDRTFVFDMNSGEWHERYSYLNYTDTRWRVNSVATAYNSVIVGDFVDGRLGILDLDELQEYGEAIRSFFTTQPFSNGGDELVIPELELTMEAGVGNDLVPDPKVGLSISRDGKTFKYERLRGIGKKGEFERRTVWHANGRVPRFAVLRFRISDPIKKVIIKLEAA